MAKLGMTFDATKVVPFVRPTDNPDDRVNRIIEGFLDEVGKAARGARNNTLNVAAFNIGRMVGAGLVSEGEAFAMLEATARRAGVPPFEMRATIKSGLTRGITQPCEDRSFTPSCRPVPSPAIAARIEDERAEQERKQSAAVKLYHGSKPIAGTRGAEYLIKRGIATHADSLRYSDTFHGLVIPITQPDGSLTAVQKIPVNVDLTRATKITNGTMGSGAFVIPGSGSATVAVDGPEDALSAHQCTGWRAIAVCGKSRLVHAVAHMVAGETLVVVRDRDETNGKEYDKATEAAQNAGVILVLIDPPEGCKDVNDVLTARGSDVVKEWLIVSVQHDEPDITEPAAYAESDLPRPTGLVKAIMDYMLSSALYQHPDLALAAALMVVGTAMGRRYAWDNLRSNLYIVGLAESGSGKNHILNQTERLLDAAGLANVLGGESPTAGTSVTNRLAEHPVTLYVIDEIGSLLEALCDSKAQSHVKEVIKNITIIFTKADGLFKGKDFADRKTNPTKIIRQPHLGILGLSVQTRVWKSITRDNIADGSLARFMFFESKARYPEWNETAAAAKPPQWIVDAIRTVWECGSSSGNLATIVSDIAEIDPTLRDVSVSPDVADLLRDRMRCQHELLNKHIATGFAPVYARVIENAKKVAFIHAVGRDPCAARIEMVDMQFGFALVEALTAVMIRRIDEKVSENEHEAKRKRVLDIIRQGGKKGVVKSRLTNSTQFLRDSKERNDILADLAESELIVVEHDQAPGGGPKRTFYKISKKR